MSRGKVITMTSSFEFVDIVGIASMVAVGLVLLTFGPLP